MTAHPEWSYPADSEVNRAMNADPTAYVIGCYMQAILERIETIALNTDPMAADERDPSTLLGVVYPQEGES